MTQLEVLLDAARNDDPRVRQEAAMVLGTLDTKPVIADLVSVMVDEPDDYVRETLIWAIVAQGSAALPALLRALYDPLAEHERVLHTLSKIEDAQAVPAIVEYADDPDRIVAAKAWWALGRIGTPECLPPLIAHLGHGDADWRLGLTRALLQFGPGAVPALAEAARHSETASVREHAVDVLVHLADPTIYRVADRGADQDAAEVIINLELPETDVVLRALSADDQQPTVAAIADELLSRRAAQS